MATETWILYGLDVWGNEEDGWDINDVSEIKRMEIPEEVIDDPDKLIKLLQEDILADDTKFDVEYNGDDYISINLDHFGGKPILELWKENK